jgi:hypothetical protein
MIVYNTQNYWVFGLKAVTDPVSETLCILVSRIQDDVQSSKTLNILISLVKQFCICTQSSCSSEVQWVGNMEFYFRRCFEKSAVCYRNSAVADLLVSDSSLGVYIYIFVDILKCSCVWFHHNNICQGVQVLKLLKLHIEEPEHYLQLTFSWLQLILTGGPRVFRTEGYVYLNTYFKFLLLTLVIFPSFLQFCREVG